MANKRRVEKGISVTVWVDEEMLERIDRLADKVNLSRSRFMRNLVEISLDDLEAMDAVGLVTLLLKIEKAKDRFKQLLLRPATTE